MKRDMELVRKIMFQFEDQLPAQNGQPVVSSNLSVDGYSSDQIVQHCLLIRDSGFLDWRDWSHNDDRYAIGIMRLMPAGHDFLEAARSDTVWNKALATAKENGISLSIDLLTQLLKSTAKKMIGLE